MKKYTIILFTLGCIILFLSFINITKSADPDLVKNFKREWIIKTADYLKLGKIDLESALYFLGHLSESLSFANIPTEVEQDKEVTVTFDPTFVAKWDQIITNEYSSLPDKKDIYVSLWNYEKFGPTEIRCYNTVPLDFYTDKNLWNSGKIIIKNFYKDKLNCIIPTSTINQFNYIVISYNIPGYEITGAPSEYGKGVERQSIISAPFKIKLKIKPKVETPTTTACNPDKLTPVRYGDKGENVANLQACLIQVGYNLPSGISGIYGAQTREVVKQFYKNELGEESNGMIFGPKAIAVLKEKLKNISVPTQKPKITITPLIRTQEVRELRPNTSTEIQFKFNVEIPTTTQVSIPLPINTTISIPLPINTTTYKLDSLVFRLNNLSKWPFEQVNISITYPDNKTVVATSVDNPISPYLVATIPEAIKAPPLVSGEYKVTIIAWPYSPQDKAYPYTGGNFSISFTSVTAKDNLGNKIESSGGDTSHTYKIIVPYYPRVTLNAKVGSEEYPALVYEVKNNIATLYFTSFTGRFNAIRAGIRSEATSTLSAPTRGITQTIEVSQDCNGTCPRDYDSLVKKFGDPDKWAIPLIRWDWSKTAQYTLDLSMNCSGYIPRINNSYPTKSFVFICSNRKAFGNNFGWDRNLILRLNWAMEGNEKLDYEVLNPAVKLSFFRGFVRSLSATIYRPLLR